jgi:hypothetical protein
MVVYQRVGWSVVHVCSPRSESWMSYAVRYKIDMRQRVRLRQERVRNVITKGIGR